MAETSRPQQIDTVLGLKLLEENSWPTSRKVIGLARQEILNLREELMDAGHLIQRLTGEGRWDENEVAHFISLADEIGRGME